MTIARCGCDSACSRVSRPSRTSSLDEAVVVGELAAACRRAGSTRASRRRGRRAAGCRRRRRPPSASCPCRVSFGSPAARSSTASFASVIASLIALTVAPPPRATPRSRSSSRPRRATCPPMPSATANSVSRSSTTCASSLLSRTRPASENAPAEVSPSLALAGRSRRSACWSPLRTRAVLATCLPFRNVPLVEPRSSMNSWPSRSTTRACTCDTKVSPGRRSCTRRPDRSSPRRRSTGSRPRLGVGLQHHDPPALARPAAARRPAGAATARRRRACPASPGSPPTRRARGTGRAAP